MENSQIARNIERIRERIAAAAARAGRRSDSILLLAVTKKVDAARVAEAYAAGVRDFGENYVQEALTKIERPSLDLPDIRWHFIGHLQRNKAKEVVGRFTLVHSVDTVALAQELARRSQQLGQSLDILLEVKLDIDGNKAGFAPDTVLEAAPQIAELEGICCRGLMGMAPFSVNPEDARPYFRRLSDLYQALPPTMQSTLSMGMSGDFEVAIEEGATLVRIGTALFGERN